MRLELNNLFVELVLLQQPLFLLELVALKMFLKEIHDAYPIVHYLNYFEIINNMQIGKDY